MKRQDTLWHIWIWAWKADDSRIMKHRRVSRQGL
ncbi:hypothetical protein CGRA01v4_11154 [Colletotrichum graminicola]|nr:hypothetical protein CGRA01v4_11154 [Colletotrichum graminicola]